MGKLATIIVPAVFNPYVIQRTAELSALYRSGIIAIDPAFDKLAASGGRILNMPFWNDLTGEDENLSATTALTPGKISAGKDMAALLMRGRAWKANDLEKALSGDDPMKAIGDLVAEYWARRLQVMLLATLKGTFAAASMSTNLLDISALVGDLACFTGATFVDATQKLGDAKDKLTGVMMHSMTEASLVKQGLITEEIETIEGTTMRVKRLLGREVIVDDGCPIPVAGTYVSYIFGKGAVAYGRGEAPVPTEVDRDSLAGDDILINRHHMILHPRGVAFQDAAVVDDAPTNAELETAANWARAYDPKNIRIVKFVHKLK